MLPLSGKSTLLSTQMRARDGDQAEDMLVLEAKKMEHTLSAPADGTVKTARYAVGEQAVEGAELVEFDDG